MQPFFWIIQFFKPPVFRTTFLEFEKSAGLNYTSIFLTANFSGYFVGPFGVWKIGVQLHFNMLQMKILSLNT